MPVMHSSGEEPQKPKRGSKSSVTSGVAAAQTLRTRCETSIFLENTACRVGKSEEPELRKTDETCRPALRKTRLLSADFDGLFRTADIAFNLVRLRYRYAERREASIAVPTGTSQICVTAAPLAALRHNRILRACQSLQRVRLRGLEVVIGK